MFWNKKDDKRGLPDLPPLKTPLETGFDFPRVGRLPENPVHADLPSFPDSPLVKDESTDEEEAPTVQDALMDSGEAIPAEKLEEPTRQPTEQPKPEPAVGQAQKIKTIELDEWNPSSDEDFRLGEPPKEKSILREAPVVREASYKPEKKSSDVFVKIEKFNTARRSLNGIKGKIDEMDLMLKKIRDIKLREEQEISGWEKDIATLKSRIQDINENIFS